MLRGEPVSTLLLRLAAPMQAWGLESKYDIRRTCKEPTKSGVIGLIAAALGIRRDEDDKLAELSAMRFGVRVDKQGIVLRDYHIVHKSSEYKSKERAYVTQRYYLSDAVFVVGLESSDEALLTRIADAIAQPVFSLYLGRRSCPPTGRVCLGLLPVPLETALTDIPPQAPQPDRTRRILFDAPSGTQGTLVRDVPISFNPLKRQYTFRRVAEKSIRLPDAAHDPMKELE